MLAPPQARRSRPGGAAPKEGSAAWTAMLPVPRKSSEIVSRQRFFIAALSLETAEGDGCQPAVTSTPLLLEPKRADSAYADQPLSGGTAFARATAVPFIKVCCPDDPDCCDADLQGPGGWSPKSKRKFDWTSGPRRAVISRVEGATPLLFHYLSARLGHPCNGRVAWVLWPSVDP